MALVINTNTMSLNAQRNLSTSASMLSTSLQRLSSGLRINSARDDAAGLAISERFTTQIRGLSQAARNANDGISLAQTAEGAIGELTNNLQRIRELAVQSANATNSASDRQALDQEVQQRLAEIDRIAATTSFNGQKVLDGTFGSAVFQVGANVGETISVNLTQGVKASQMGQIASGTSAAEVTVANLTGTGTIQVGTGPATVITAAAAGLEAGQSIGSAYAKVNAINGAHISGLTATATNNIELQIAATAGTSATDTYSLRINGNDIFAAYDQGANGVLSAQQITDAINGKTQQTGVTAVLSGGVLRLTAGDGRDIAIGQDLGAGATGGITAGTGGASTVNGVVYRDGQIGAVAGATANSANAANVNGGLVTLSAAENISIVGDGAILGFATANATITKDTQTLSQQNVLTVAGANSTMQRVDVALTAVSALRSSLGSIQSRFESTISSLQATTENLSASRSRILDTDFAAETANLTKGQILQQAGTAILAQANSIPQNVLSLLR